jgi:hypothetical protein
MFARSSRSGWQGTTPARVNRAIGRLVQRPAIVNIGAAQDEARSGAPRSPTIRSTCTSKAA